MCVPASVLWMKSPAYSMSFFWATSLFGESFSQHRLPPKLCWGTAGTSMQVC